MHHSQIDQIAQGHTLIHQLDARVKLAVVVAYTAVLISFGRYAVAVMFPMVLLPAAMLWLGEVPMRLVFRRILIASPLILSVAIASPIYDRTMVDVQWGPWQFAISGGWLTATGVTVKFILGLALLTALTATTPFARLLRAMRRVGIPAVLVEQIGFLWRYLFVLIDQALAMRMARQLRGGDRAPLRDRLASVGGAIGSLLIRTLDRSERIHLAMQARGYRGAMPQLSPEDRLRWADGIFVASAAAMAVFGRIVYPEWIAQ